MKKNSLTLRDVTIHRAMLYGFAALWILFYHLTIAVPNRLYLRPLKWMQDLGLCGVEIFLLLGGFGLYGSLKKNRDLKRYYLRRFQRLVLPTMATLILFAFIEQRSVERLVSALLIFPYWFGAGVPWYVAFAAMLYLVYPLIFVLQEKDQRSTWALFVLSLIACFALQFIVPYKFIPSLMRIPVALLGCALAPAAERTPPGDILPCGSRLPGRQRRIRRPACAAGPG